MIEKMRDVSNHINELTHALADNSRELLDTTESMNKNAHEQIGQTEQVASAVLEMSQTFGDVGAEQARGLAGHQRCRQDRLSTARK